MSDFVSHLHANLFGLPPLDMRIEPGLVRAGESVSVRLSAQCTTPPDGRLTVEADYLGKAPDQPRALRVDWQKAGETEWRAACQLVADRSGNWRFVWRTGEHRLSRILGVVETGQVVVTLWGGANVPRLDREIHQYDLPADHWVDSGLGMPPEKVVESMKPYARDAFHFGDRLTPVCNADGLFPGISDKNLFKVPLEAQRRAIRQLQELWRLLGLKELEILASYTPGHGTFGLLAELGFKALNSLCVWQNWLDGVSPSDWQINHVGCPISPYYPAADDFRKVAAGRSLVAFSMGTSSSSRCYDIMCFDGCPTNCTGQIRYWRLPGVGSNVHRFNAALDGWIQDARNNPEPVFVTVGLENFYNCPESRKANEDSVHYMVRRAGEGKVVFASAADIADFYQRQYPVQPEHVYFQPDTMLGIRGGSKPARIPDRIELVNREFHSLHKDGEVLPQFLWDHTVPWQNPEWADQQTFRDPYGLVPPETIAATVNPQACVPRQTDLRGVTVDIERTPDSGGVRVTARIVSPVKINLLPLAVWRLPLDPERGGRAVESSPGSRWIPVRDGWSGNLHGILALTDVPAGTSEWSLRVAGAAKPSGTIDFSVDGVLAGRTMRMTEETRTYFWRETVDCRLKVRIRVPPGRPAAAMYLDGRTVRPDAEGNLEIVLDEHWSHEAPTLIGAAPVACGGDAVITVSRVQPIRMSPEVQDWRVSPVLELAGTWESLQAPADTSALRLTPHRIPRDFAAVNLDRLKGAAGNAVVYQMARFRSSDRTRVCVDLGYDGPVKAWLDGRLLFFYPQGTPPWSVEAGLAFQSEAGDHDVLLAFGPNGGLTWGVRLRILWAGEEVTPDRFIPSHNSCPAPMDALRYEE